jgi:hypothetical protein
VDVAWEVHERHLPHQEAREETITIHAGHLSARFPGGIESAPETRERVAPRDSVELEAGVAGVHVEMDPVAAAEAQHRLSEAVRVDAR